MRKISRLLQLEEEEQVRALLFQNEALHITLIDELLQKNGRAGDLFVQTRNEKISAVLYSLYDGNSHYTTFAYDREEDLLAIAEEIKTWEWQDVLLSGPSADVQKLLTFLEQESDIDKSAYYSLPQHARSRYEHFTMEAESKGVLRRARHTGTDVAQIKRLTSLFFGAETPEEEARVTEDAIIQKKIDSDLYVYTVDNHVVGMIRYYAQSPHYVGLTGLYVDKAHRGEGVGRAIMEAVTSSIVQSGRTPVFQVNMANTIARGLYEALGYELLCPYAFQFVTTRKGGR